MNIIHHARKNRFTLSAILLVFCASSNSWALNIGENGVFGPDLSLQLPERFAISNTEGTMMALRLQNLYKTPVWQTLLDQHPDLISLQDLRPAVLSHVRFIGLLFPANIRENLLKDLSTVSASSRLNEPIDAEALNRVSNALADAKSRAAVNGSNYAESKIQDYVFRIMEAAKDKRLTPENLARASNELAPFNLCGTVIQGAAKPVHDAAWAAYHVLIQEQTARILESADTQASVLSAARNVALDYFSGKARTAGSPKQNQPPAERPKLDLKAAPHLLNLYASSLARAIRLTPSEHYIHLRLIPSLTKSEEIQQAIKNAQDRNIFIGLEHVDSLKDHDFHSRALTESPFFIRQTFPRGVSPIEMDFLKRELNNFAKWLRNFLKDTVSWTTHGLAKDLIKSLSLPLEHIGMPLSGFYNGGHALFIDGLKEKKVIEYVISAARYLQFAASDKAEFRREIEHIAEEAERAGDGPDHFAKFLRRLKDFRPSREQ